MRQTSDRSALAAYDRSSQLNRHLADAAYAKSQRVSAAASRATAGSAVARMLRADAALSLILDRLQEMRDLAGQSAARPLTEEQRLSCQADVERLKDDISRLSGAIARAGGAGRGFAEGEMEESAGRIDESVGRLSRMTDGLAARRNDEKMEGWMNSILGPGQK